MTWREFFARLLRHRLTDSARAAVVPATVVGVYATVHTTAGDFTTKTPERIDIDCEIVTFSFPLPDAPFTGTITSSTLHFGIYSVECQVNPPVQVREGDNVHVIQPYEVASLTYSGSDRPEWAKL